MPPKPQEPGRPLIFCHPSRNIATQVPDTLSAALASASLYYPQLRRPLRLTMYSPSGKCTGPVDLTEPSWSTTLIQKSSIYELLLNVVEATEAEEADYKLRMEQEIGLDSDGSGCSGSGDDEDGLSETKETSRKRRKLGNGARSSEAVEHLLAIDARIKIGEFEGKRVVKAWRSSKTSRMLDALADQLGVAQGSLGALSKRHRYDFKDEDAMGEWCAIGEGTPGQPMKIYVYSLND